MDFDTLERRALDVRDALARREQQRYGREWTLEKLALGLVGDIGDLAKLIPAHEGVDLPAAFLRTMDDIASAIDERR